MSNKINMKTVDGLKQFVAFKGYDPTTAYSLNDVVVSIQNNEIKIYQSLADNNTSSLSDTTKWKEVSLGGGAGGEIGDMGFAPLGIDESLNLRRYLNGQVISQSLSPSFTTKVKQAIALFPNLGTTESNWQSEKTLSKLGQCGKFVVDDTEGTIRLPAVVNVQGLLSLSAIGTIKDESLPNITGSATAWNDSDSQRTDFGIVGGKVTGAFTRRTGYRNGAVNPTTITADYNASTTMLGFEAHLSSSTYKDDAPVQQEAVQYPYYIQIATGVEETLPAIREYKVNNSDYFGKSMYSDVAPDNASWLASNGSYNARTVYPDYYDWLNGKIGQVITANGGKVVLSTDTITDYDFVVNQNDQTFRLPLLNGEEDLSGNAYEAITLKPSGSDYIASKNGEYSFVVGCTTTSTGTTGVLLQNTTAGNWDGDQIAGVTNYKVFTANIKAKKGDTVNLSYYNLGTISSQYFRFIPSVGNGTLYYYVGDTVQDASLINAGAVLGQLSNKADIDASNFNATGRSYLSGIGMPSTTYDELTLGASGSTYTAPANGYFYLNKTAGSDFYYTQIATIKNGEPFRTIFVSEYRTSICTFLYPVRKGEVVQITYNATGATNSFRFFYADGEN